MKRLWLLLFMPVLLGCPPKPPPVVVPCPPGQHAEAGVCVPDVPPPPVEEGRPASPIYLDLLLRSTPEATLARGGQPFTLIGGIPCWTTPLEDGTDGPLVVNGKPIPYWWSLVSPEWMDETKKVGMNAVHVRVGPGVAAELCCGMEEVGGPYAEAPPMLLRRMDRKLRAGTEWNPKYWGRLQQVLHHGGRTGFTVEVDVLDGWQVKHAVWGDVHMPWPAGDVHTGLTYPPNASVREWVRKVVYETCNHAQVIYQISNESALGPGWSVEWERAIHGLIREGEQQPGCGGVVHMIGSNSRDDGGPYDYFTTHNGSALDGPFAGRPIMTNEYNPSQTPEMFIARHCVSRPQSFWYWRSDGSNARQDASLNALRAGCKGATGCPDPQPLPVSTYACRWNGQWWDCTPQQHGCEQCAAIGMGEFGGNIRCDCPVRNECPDTPGYEGMCDSRATCERVAMGGFPVWKGDAPVTVNEDNENRLQARCDGCSTLTICSADGVTGCTKVF